jgi:hypothetical protein
VLIHLHGGSVGWITLSAIGIAVWVMSGDRDVSAAYEKNVTRLTWAAVLVFGGYVPTFGLAFSRSQGFLVALLPIFGSLAVLTLWVSAIWALSQLRRQPVVTTVHLLAAGALLVAAIGATVGMLLGLERVIGQFLPLPQGEDRVGAHAGMMDTYLFLIASAIVEWFTRKDAARRWSWPGLIQGLAWTIGATLVPVAYFLNLLEQMLPIFGLLLLLGMAIFLIRIAWRAVIVGPFAKGVKPWAFFGAIWLVIYMGLFLMAIGTGGDFASLPPWFFAAFAHAGFVGMMTNLLFGVISARAWDSRQVLGWGEATSMWLMNLGIIAFIGLKISSDIRTGAIVMGVGVLLGVFTMLLRLRASGASQSMGAA